ncbi:MAG: hypothetical protein ACLU9S_18800 [Oscillospiraceae bacterium]
MAECEKTLSRHLGRAVKIVNGKRKGRFELEFYGPEDLQRLYEALADPAKGDEERAMRNRREKKEHKSGHELLEKMGQLIEEQPEEGAAPPEKQPETTMPPNRNRALMTYIAFLFGVAFILVLLSFLIQQKDSQQTISELNQNANSALSRAEQLQDNNRQLLEANQALQTQVEQLQADQNETKRLYQELEETYASLQEDHQALLEQSAEHAQQVKAYELLLTAERALDEENTEAFLSAMKSLKPLAENLDAKGKALYQELLPFVTEAQENTGERNP